MRYAKVETVLRIALDMQTTAEGLSLEDIRREYCVCYKTAGLMRNAVGRVFPQMVQANPGETPMRWRIPPGTISRISITAGELADLEIAAALLPLHSENLKRVISKIRAVSRPEALTRVDPDLDALKEREHVFPARTDRSGRHEPSILQVLRAAVVACRCVELSHCGFVDTVQPYALAYGSAGGPYLVAWATSTRDWAHYALSRIERADMLGMHFVRQEFSLNAYAERHLCASEAVLSGGGSPCR